MNYFDFIIPSEGLPVISQSATIEEAHNKMCMFGLGFCYIVDKSNKLLAVFTDGDFRRLILNTSTISSIFFNYTALDYSSLDPISIDIAQDPDLNFIRSLFIEHKIYDLPVTHSTLLVGSINIRSLL